MAFCTEWMTNVSGAICSGSMSNGGGLGSNAMVLLLSSGGLLIANVVVQALWRHRASTIVIGLAPGSH